MTDLEDTQAQLAEEIQELRKRLAELEATDAKCKVLEEALQEWGMRFRSIVESTVDAIISTEADDKITFWNQGAKNVFGYSEEEILGKPVTILMPERYREQHAKGVQRYVQTGRPSIIGKTAEMHGLRKDGSEFPIELSLSTWKTKQKTFFSGIIRDISDRKQAEKALERRTEELESLVQMVAHDLKSPVITVVGLVRLLRHRLAKLSPDSRIEQIFGQIVTSAESMENFLKDLLDGLAASYGEPQMCSFRMEEAIEEIVLQHRHTIGERGIRLMVNVAGDLPPVLADRHRIFRVLDNLLANAIKHMGEREDAQIRIAVTEYEGFVFTSVADNGVGIPREYHAKIFDRFFRVPGSDAGKGGTGLGLFIVRKIVESHRGRVWVESEVGKGATFIFTLPKSQEAL